MIVERWIGIVGFEELYQVSDSGRIKSLSRVWITGRSKCVRKKGETIMKLSIDSGGYCQVDLSKDGKNKKYSVHRIVAEAFIDNPSKKKCINHKNSIRSDNRVENLEWVTYSENTKHAVSNGRQYVGIGENHPMSILNEKDVFKIRELHGDYTHNQLASMFNIGRRAIGHIITRKTWKHI